MASLVWQCLLGLPICVSSAVLFPLAKAAMTALLYPWWLDGLACPPCNNAELFLFCGWSNHLERASLGYIHRLPNGACSQLHQLLKTDCFLVWCLLDEPCWLSVGSSYESSFGTQKTSFWMKHPSQGRRWATSTSRVGCVASTKNRRRMSITGQWTQCFITCAQSISWPAFVSLCRVCMSICLFVGAWGIQGNSEFSLNFYPSWVRSQRPILVHLCINWRGKG